MIILKKIYLPHSLGFFYTAISQFLGFHNYGDEYKLMGLALYGEPNLVDIIRNNLIDINDDGSIELNLKYFDNIKSEIYFFAFLLISKR